MSFFDTRLLAAPLVLVPGATVLFFGNRQTLLLVLVGESFSRFVRCNAIEIQTRFAQRSGLHYYW